MVFACHHNKLLFHSYTLPRGHSSIYNHKKLSSSFTLDNLFKLRKAPYTTMDIKKTQVIKIDPNVSIKENDLKVAIDLIKKGEVVAFPTETVYGLGANALDARAVEKIFKAKNRPSDNPLICHIGNKEMLNKLVDDIPTKAQILIDHFWPGPLTILFRKKNNVIPDIVTCGLDTVAIRMPVNPIALSLIQQSDLPIAAPSANISGKPSPTNAQHVYEDMNGKIQCIIDGGQCEVGLESTVIDINREPPLILRPGGVTLEMIRRHLPNAELYAKSEHVNIDEEKPPTPGLKYRHYSPDAKVVLYSVNDPEKYKSVIIPTIEESLKDKSVALIMTKTHIEVPQHIKDNSNFVSVELKDDPVVVAHQLFLSLRKMDEMNIGIVFIEGIEEKDVGVAVMNRLKKAASLTIGI